MTMSNMMLEITSRCNERCPICEANIHARDYVTMEDEMLEELVDLLVANGVTSFSFTGGEPTIAWRTLVAGLRRCKHHGCATRMYSNGVGIRQDRLAELGRLLDDLVLSLDSTRQESFEILRGVRRGLEQRRSVIRMLAKTPVLVIVISMCSAVNKTDLYELAAELDELGVGAWWIQQFIPQGLGAVCRGDFEVSNAEFEKIIGDLRGLYGGSIRAFTSGGEGRNRIFVNCEGDFVDYESGEVLGAVRDDSVRTSIFSSPKYDNRKRV